MLIILYLMLLSPSVLWAATVQLTWTAPTHNADGSPVTDLAGYRLAYGTVAGQYPQSVTVGLVTSHTLTLPGGQTYHFVARSRDTGGNESANSNVASITLAADPTPPPTSGLLAAYSFSEGSGTSTADATGHDFTGTLVNGPSWIAGKYGKALQFDGSNDFVRLPSSLDIPALPFTLSAWVYPTSRADWRAIFSKRTSYSATQMRVDLVLTPTEGRVRLAKAGMQQTFTHAPALHTWTHVGVVADVSATRLYLNGVLKQTFGPFTLGTGPVNAPVTIGAAQNGTVDRWAGRLDEVRLYTRALTAAEMVADMNTPVGSGSVPSVPTGASGLTVAFE